MTSALFLILLCSSLIGANQLFAESYQSDNGLTTSGTGTSTKVSLGGSLIGNTTLNLGGNNLILNGPTAEGAAGENRSAGKGIGEKKMIAMI